MYPSSSTQLSNSERNSENLCEFLQTGVNGLAFKRSRVSDFIFLFLWILFCGCATGDSSNRDSLVLFGESVELTLRVDFAQATEKSAQQTTEVDRVFIEVLDADTGVGVVPAAEIQRPSIGTIETVVFRGVPPGRLNVRADFFASSGELLGRDTKFIDLAAGQTVTITLSYQPGPTPSPPPPPLFREFLVALNIEEALVFELDANTGILTEVFRENFGADSLPFSVASRADGAVYITFTLADQIGHFQVDPLTGSLEPRTVIARDLPEGGAVSPDGRFYFHCEPRLALDGSVRAYSLDPSTGTPTELPDSPFVIPGSSIPQRIFVHPNGQFLYVAERDSSSPNGMFYIFEIDTTTGLLTQVGGPVEITAPRAFAFATSPNGDTLFVCGNDNQVDAFAINQGNGTLTPLQPTFVAQDSQLGEMVVDADNQVFYVCGFTTGQVEAYRLDGNGRPGGPIASSPFPTFTTGTLTTLINSSGDFLITTNTGALPNDGTVSCFRIQPDGNLSPVPGSPFSAGIGTFDMTLVRLEN